MQSAPLKLLLLTILVVVIYYPGKNGPFLADDYPNIIDNAGIQIKYLNIENLSSAWNANRSGLLGRPIASLSFALNYYFSGQQWYPAHLKITNVAIHILNSFLVFFISQLLFSIFPKRYPAQKLAFICALIWAIHPLQLTSVLYVVQRMTSLSCFFMLSGFLIFLSARLQIEKPGRIALMYAGCILGMLLGGLTKENALLLPFLIFATEITLLRAVSVGTGRNKLYYFYAVTVVIPLILAIGYFFIHPEIILGGYNDRNFTLIERLMTQARVLLYYLGLLFYPDNTQLSLNHDDFVLSRSLFDPVTTLPSIVIVITLLTVAIVNVIRNKAPFLSFAIAWFFIAQSMESSIIPLEMIYEHRNYVPSIGIVISIIALLHSVTKRLEKKYLINILYAIIIISFSATTFTRADIWSDRDRYVYFAMRNHPLSARTQSEYAKNVELNHGTYTEIYEHYRLASQLNEFDVSTLIEMFITLNRIINLHNAANDDAFTLLPVHYDARLILNHNYMQVLLPLIHQEIVQRINYKSNPVTTLATLRTTATCLIDQGFGCTSIASNILEWADAALTHANFPDKSQIYTIKAKIYFSQGNLEKSLDYISKAIKHSPNDYYFYAEKAYLYSVLNEYEKAEQILNDVDTHIKLSGFDRRELNKLRQAIDYKKQAKSLNMTQ